MSNPIQVPVFPVNQVVFKATKAVVATVTALLGVIGLFSVLISDGSLSGSDVGELVTALGTAGATILAVWRVPNEVKGTK